MNEFGRRWGEVTVVGGGVIGLTTAVVLAESGHCVRVVTRDPVGQTTSAVAGALWEPYLAEPRQIVAEWAHRSYPTFAELTQDPRTGVRMVEGTTAHPRPGLTAPWWAAEHPNLVRLAAPGELPAGYASGWTARLPLVDMPLYLDYLTQRLVRAGGEIEIGPVASLTELDVPLIVNCTGLGAHDLVPDPTLRPVLGHLAIVNNTASVTRWFVEAGGGEETTYIFPQLGAGTVVLGGTAIADRWDTSPNPEVAARIIQRCARVIPALADAPLVDHRVGLRPTRPVVRLEREILPTGAVCVHSYGHGGCGVTVSWACAADTASLLAV
ncbi:FAD-dependent oxidoreductase [Streptomyces millisiae]|uniref:D-amino-acid oxidase n=1 Tax=Streptomyces millisiae TaxID=3075542 RepID=A0ABU2LWE4_9ACTN|nr:FAD-dependent oxidoreductase [Streptomyces sp. DSM 44918]MDT0321901.1 FAD-dependent oxidoreductase [Streptomyces sp. DSM 44918]